MRRSYLLAFGCFVIVGLAIFLPIAFTQDLFDGVRGEQGTSSERPIAEKVECTLFLEDAIPEPGNEDFVSEDIWTCINKLSGTEYSLDGISEDFLEQYDVRSGVTVLTITSTLAGQIVQPKFVGVQESNSTSTAQKKNTTFGFKEPSAQYTLNIYGSSISTSAETPSLSNAGEWQTKHEGQVSMLIVRVTDGDGLEPAFSAAEMSDVVFGTNGDLVNLRSQYMACSGGKLEFTPAVGNGITDGVLEVSIEQRIKDVDRSQVQKWVTETVPDFLGGGRDESYYDYTMYVFPQGANFRGAGAYAAVGGRRSVYNNRNIGVLLVQMHEVGHSLQLRHSGFQGSTYGDHTCFEGAHLWEGDAPVMCFNGAKSWFLGWYNDTEKRGHDLIQPTSGGWVGKLTGIDEYINNDDYTDIEHKVVLKVETANLPATEFPDLYVMYNRKEGVNKNVQAFGDKVTVVSQYREAGAQSWLYAALDDDEGTDTFRQSNFDKTGLDLVIKVCYLVYEHPQPDYAKVIVYLDDNTRRLECDSAFPSVPLVDGD